MPKDAPRKFKPAAPNPNKQKVADFSKVKTKLGKGKQVAQNATDTSYKARSIALPNQSIGVVHDEGERLTKSGKTWEELRIGSRHYNVAIRRDSINGMKELLLAYQDLRIAQFPALIQAVCKTLTDAEASVRSLLPPLLSAILPLVSTSTLAPHLPILLLHATSALSSIFPAVRVDAVRVLGVLLDEGGAGCDRIADGWETGSGGRGEGGRVLEGLLAVLGVGGKGETAGSNAPLGTASKLVVFQALLKFLSHAFADRSLTPSSTSRTSTFSFLAPSFATPQAFEQFATSLEALSTASGAGKGKARAGEWALDLSGWERGDLELEGGAGSNGGEVDKGRKITELYLSLHPLLLSTFLDSAPSAFSPSAPTASSASMDVHLQTLSSILAFCNLLGLTALRTPANAQTSALWSALEVMLKHMRPYFPFSEKTFETRSGRDEALLVKMELDYASLTSLLAPGASAVSVPPRTKADGPKDRAKALEDAFRRARRGVNEGKRRGVEEVAEWVAALLSGERSTLASPLGVNVSRDLYLDIRECVWALLSLPPPGSKKAVVDMDTDDEPLDVPGLVWEALVDHCLRLGSTDPVKKVALEFIGRLCLLETEPLYTGLFRLNDASRPRVEKFYASLPRMLWELRSKDLSGTTTLLRLVHSLLLAPMTSSSLTPVLLGSLPPYFHSTHPTRGDVLGPWASLPDVNVRRLALDVARTAIEGADEESSQKLRDAVGKAVVGRESDDDATYWAGIVAVR